eukprot:IDg12102t1
MTVSEQPCEQTALLSSCNTERQPDYDDNISYTDTLRYCFTFIIPPTARDALVAFACVISILAAKVFHLVMGLFMKLAVDALSSSDPAERQRCPFLAAVLFLIGRIGVALSTQAYEVAQEHYAQRVLHRFAVHAFAAVMHQSVAFHVQRRTGETTAIVRRGVAALDTLLRQLAFWLLPTLVETVYVTAIFYHLGSPAIALAVAATVIVHVAYTARLTSHRAALARRQRDAENAAWAHATERVAEHATVSVFAAADFEVAQHDELRLDVRRTTFDAKRLTTFYDVSADVILQTGTFAGFVLAARDAAAGRLSVGDFALAVTYISALFWPLLVLAQSYGQVVTALANAEQVVRLLRAPRFVHDAPDARSLPSASTCAPAAVFERVSFSYDGGSAGAVRDVSFTLRRGRVLGIVGPSGAGKSTLARLLLRLHDAHEGAVRVHGADVRDVRIADLRRAIAVVVQDTVLLSGNIRDNVRYARPDLLDAAVWEALRGAALDDFVRTLEDGLDTRVGERGVRLSGGERQRVGIARALLRDANIVVLDEATSALSALDEIVVQERLAKLLADRAVLVVAHRLASVRHADEILVMDKGYVVERGRHAQLVVLNGIYARMWRAQAGAMFRPVRWLRSSLRSDVTLLSFFLYLAAALLSICFLVHLNASQAFIFSNVIGVDTSRLGEATGSLALYDELLSLAAVLAWGVLSDRIGRRIVYTLGFLIIGVATIVFPFASNLYPQLLLARLLFAIGAASTSTMLTAVLADFARDANRGFISGAVGLASGLGAIIALFVFLRLPVSLEKSVADPIAATRVSYAIVGGISILFCVPLWFFLKPKSRVSSTNSTEEARQPHDTSDARDFLDTPEGNEGVIAVEAVEDVEVVEA